MPEWDFKTLFKDTLDFDKQESLLKDKLAKLAIPKVIEANSFTILLKNYFAIKELNTKILVYGSLKYYKDTKEENLILKSKVEKTNNVTLTKLKEIEDYIITLGYPKVMQFIKENKDLKTYEFYLSNLFRLRTHIVIDKEIEKNNDAINTFVNKQNILTKEMTFKNFTILDNTYYITLSNMAKYLSSRDRNIRKQTFFSVNDSYAVQKDLYASLMANIFIARHKNAKLENYKSVLEKSLFEENIPTTLIDNLLNCVHKALPTMQKYLYLKGKYLKLANPHIYDLGVPLDNDLKKKYSLDEAIYIIKESLKPLGEEYQRAIDKILKGHVDALPDASKHQSIVFSWLDYSFLNFRGSYNDIKNLTHELGHSISYYLSRENCPFIYADSTVFCGEIASIVNEIMLNNYLLKTSTTKEEKIFYLSKRIENYFTSVFKQTLYTEYEHKLYDLCSKTPLTSDILSSSYYSLLEKYYGNFIIIDEIASIEWTRLGHLYRHSYYSYKYATGLLLASNIVTNMENSKLSIDKYMNFIKSGSKNYSTILLKEMDIDLDKKDVFANGFNILSESIAMLSDLLK